MADAPVQDASETVTPAHSEVADASKNNVEGPVANLDPSLQPTNKTAEEIVAEIMAEVPDEGVRKSFERMSELETELQTKLEKMQTSFTDKMKSIQEDIDKFWAVDKEYEKYHQEMDKLLNESTEETLGSDEIKKMIKDFKEGNYKEGLSHVTSNGEGKSGGLLPSDEKVLSPNSSTDVSTEDAFDDASSETSESSTLSHEGAPAKTKKTRKSEDAKGKGEDGKGKKPTKKKALKN